METQHQNHQQSEQAAMTHQQALNAAKAMGIDMLDAQLLLLHALGRSLHERAWLLAHDTDQMLPEEQQQYIALLQRRAIGVPVAYLTGVKEFYGLPFTVDKRVLVPRPETEMLVDWAAELVESSKTEALNVLDLGTGSGILAITLKHLHPALEVTAVDKSEHALSVAVLNASDLLPQNQSIRFLQGEWFSPLNHEKFDLIVSNPPYVAEHDEHLQALEHEPIEALTSGLDGLNDIKTIVQQAGKHLSPGGWLLLEHGYDQASQVRTLLEEAGFAHVQTRHDLSRIERMTGGCWKPLCSIIQASDLS
ncbi:MAG: peptide chain release factor N(5)-glutamine methyltransferase [Saezia sp.]